MAGFTRARPSAHWVDYPDTTYGVVRAADFDKWDTAVFDLKTEVFRLIDYLPLYGETWSPVTSATSSFNAILSDIDAAGRGVIQLPPGAGVINNVTSWPVNKLIVIKGTGGGCSGNIYGTRIQRDTDSPIFTASGTGTGSAERLLLELHDLEFYGGGAAFTSDIYHFSRCSHFRMVRCRTQNGAAGGGAHFSQLWDSSFQDAIFERMGTGTSIPAVLFDSVAGDGATGDCATVQAVNSVFQSNFGTDLKLTGSIADGSAANDFEFVNTKMEGTGSGTSGSPDAYPYIDLDYAQDCTFTNTRISMPTGRASVFVQQIGTSAGARANTFTNTIMDVAGSNGPARYIDHASGSLAFYGVNWPGRQPSVEYVRVQSSVGAGRFKMLGVNEASANVASGFITDTRTTNEELAKGILLVFPPSAGGTATAGTIGDCITLDFADAATSTAVTQVTLPKDAHPLGQARLRLHWTANISDATKNCQWQLTAKTYAAAADVSAAGATFTATAAAPATASQLQVTSFTSGPACVPGALMTVSLARLGSDAADTMAATAQLVKAELIYDRRI